MSLQAHGGALLFVQFRLTALQKKVDLVVESIKPLLDMFYFIGSSDPINTGKCINKRQKLPATIISMLGKGTYFGQAYISEFTADSDAPSFLGHWDKEIRSS